MKSAEFFRLPPEVQDGFQKHYSATLQYMMSLPQIPQPEAVKTTLQLKGTVGPTVGAEILNRSGVLQATPEQLSEQPLETWVTNSLDKPNAEGTGNDPIQAAVQDAAVLHKAELDAQAQDVSSMQAAHKSALAHQSSAVDQAAKAQAMRHAEELHQQKMAHAEQAHKVSLRAQAQASANPKK